MDDLIAWCRTQLDDDEAWARGASRVYPYADDGATAPVGGVHWRWVAGEHWGTVTPDPVGSEFVAESGDSCHLATIEEWPSTTRWDAGTHLHMMPLTYDDSIVEMDSAAAGHIVRHDPARVLREVDAKRQRLSWIESELTDDETDETARWLLALEALPYADRPGYREEWRP